MDSYEESRDPPQLHLLDKFDTGGPGSCLKRYSDPTFFKRTSTSGKVSLEKVRSDKKAQKIKRKRSLVHNGEVIHGASVSSLNSSLQFTSLTNQGASFSQTATADTTMKSDAGDSSNSFDSGTGSGYAGNVLKLGSSMQTKEREFRESSSSSLMQFSDAVDSVVPDEQRRIVDDKFQYALEDQNDLSFSSHVTWDEKAEIVKPRSQHGVSEKAEIVWSRDQQDVREMAEIVQPRTQQDVRNTAEIVQARTQWDVREMSEMVQPRTQQDVRERAESLQPRTQQDVRERAESLQPMTQQDVREMAEMVQPMTRQDVRKMEEMVQPRTPQNVRELAEIVQPRTQQDVREMAEIVQPRTQQDVREMAEIVQPRTHQDVAEMVQPRTQQDVREMTEIVQPKTRQDVREMAEIVQPRTRQDVREMAETVQPRAQLGNVEKAEIVGPGSQQDGREKLEIVEPSSQQDNKDKEYEVLVPKYTLDPHEMEDFYLRNDEQISMLANDGHQSESIYDRNVFDEIESETDNYMDALNTIESESETDLDCQTKREVEPCLSNIKCEAEDPMHDLLESSLNPDITILNLSNDPQKSFDKGIISNLVSSDSFYHDQRLENTLKVSSPDRPQVTNLHGKEISTLESDISNSFPPDSTSSLEDHSGIRLLNKVHESGKTSLSSNPSDRFWTNGGLLGLQPSKPPSWAVSNASSEDSSKGEKRGPYDHAYVINGNAQEIKVGILHKDGINNEKDSTSNKSSLHHGDQKYDTSGNILRTCTPFQELSRGDLNAKNESFSINNSSNGSSCAHMNDMVKPSAIMAGIASPAVPDVNGMCTRTGMEKDENSNQISGLSDQLFVNGFHRKLTLIHDESFETTSISKEHLGCDSPIDSCPPSPPLDHMKISFHPVCSFELSKLKLKFPDGSEGRGSTKDIFPSFQLAPEESISVHEIGSESDDDTFCRSSPCMSDDCLSDHSKSNSDLWESDDTPESKGQNLYDLHMSQMDSSFELEGIPKNGITVVCGSGSLNTRNGMDESLAGPLLDLPCFDIVNPAMSERINNIDAVNLLKSQCSDNPTPAPPPLPPAQWCVSKASLDMSEDQKDLTANPKQVEPVVFQQQITHESIETKPNAKKPEQVTMHDQKEKNRIGNGNVMDAREDFLQQIRAKSFNLRRTVTEKPTTTAGPATHVKVTAILEKANAIRQAVGSDNGEDDDSWSDG
ncbi:protein SCAR3-like isoform X2 [Momordica charantia]|nr:protein SCAR3-like isoform X2 [Momordica charantia]